MELKDLFRKCTKKGLVSSALAVACASTLIMPGADAALAATYHIGAGSACTGNGVGNTGTETASAWLTATTRNECRVAAVAHCTNGDWVGGWHGPTLGDTSSKICPSGALLYDMVGRWQTALYY